MRLCSASGVGVLARIVPIDTGAGRHRPPNALLSCFQVNRIKSILLAIVLSVGASGVARGGLPHWQRRLRPPYPSNSYAPETRHYTVVDPVAAETPRVARHSLLSKVPSPGQVLWRQNVEPAPTYPWGWFGARRHVQNADHRRFYGGERDWAYLRGD